MPTFDLELTDPAPAAVEKAMADAVENANLRCRVGLLKADPAEYRRFVVGEFASRPEGVALWLSDKGRVEEYPPTPRGTLLGVAWRTTPTGRLARVAGRRIEPFKESPANRFGPPWRSWPALCHLDPDHVVTRQLAGGDPEAIATCGCGAVGPPERLNWMAGRCGPCHDHFEEYGTPLPGTKPVALRTKELLFGVGFLMSGEAVAAVGTLGWREPYTVAVWDRLTGACHADLPTYYSKKAVPKSSAPGGLGLWCEHGIIWVKGKGKGAALSIAERPLSAAATFDGPVAALITYTGEAWRRDLTVEGEWKRCWPERRGADRDGIYYSVALSPDRKKVALGLSSCDVEVLDWPKGGEAVELPALALKDPAVMRVYSLAFSPDGKLLAAGIGRSGFVTDPSQEWIGRAGGVALYDLATKKMIAKVLTPKDDIMAVAFSPDGSHLFWGSTDCTVRALDVATKEEVAVLSGHTGGVNALAFSPDGKTLASAGGDGLVRLWPWRELLARPEQSSGVAKKRVAVGGRRAK
jgi:hypothetical protein